jgi:hypothetical protein
MAALRAQIQRLLDGTIQPEKGLSNSLPTPMKGALINLQQALRPVQPAIWLRWWPGSGILSKTLESILKNVWGRQSLTFKPDPRQ